MPKLGELYKKLVKPKTEKEKKEEEKKLHPFYVFAKQNYARARIKPGKEVTLAPGIQDALDFLGWDLTKEEFSFAIASKTRQAIFTGVFLFAFLYVLINFVFTTYSGYTYYLFYYFGPIFIIGIIYYIFYYQKLPITLAKQEATKALGYVPQILSYLIMSMKLVPNMEKAVKFASEHGKGRLAEELKQLLWEFQLGKYSSMEEALDNLAYKYSIYVPEFKKAVMSIRSSVVEKDEIKRNFILDKALEDALASIKLKMEVYARNLNQPATFLFYLGILLPLILLIIVPLGAMFGAGFLANPLFLIFLYNIAIPGTAFYMAKRIVDVRPPTNPIPEIGEDHPDLPKKGLIFFDREKKKAIGVGALIFLILIFGLVFSMYLHKGLLWFMPIEQITAGLSPTCGVLYCGFDNTLEKIAYRQATSVEELKTRLTSLRLSPDPIDKQEYLNFKLNPDNDTTPFFLILGLILTFCLIFAVSQYGRTKYRRELQEEVTKMEEEFKDSIYLIASRLAEGKPVEEAIEYTKEFMPRAKISKKVFARLLHNLKLLGMPLEVAIFDENIGALRNIPSEILLTSFKVLIDAVSLGVNVASRTLISLALQLKNAEEISNLLKMLVHDITNMMTTMAVFIAPIILGITTAMQKIIIKTIMPIVAGNLFASLSQVTSIRSLQEAGGFGAGGIEGMFGNLSTLETRISPENIPSTTLFLIVVTIYVIELLYIMVYFSVSIREGHNPVAARLEFAKRLPLAIFIFLLTIVLANIIGRTL